MLVYETNNAPDSGISPIAGLAPQSFHSTCVGLSAAYVILNLMMSSSKDIDNFFAPLSPVNIVIGLNADGRKSGEADCDFSTHEQACEAMKKDKTNMRELHIPIVFIPRLLHVEKAFCSSSRVPL